MKNKLTIILGLVFLVGLVAAAGTITNLSPAILNIPEFIAGGTTSTEFNFDYPAFNETYQNQEDNAPLMIKVDIASDDQINYPVWKGDFQLDGSMVNKGWFVLPDTYYSFNCYENDFTYKYVSQIQEIKNIPDGTFYCYNPQLLAMKEGSSNDVTLNISSDPALYPGTYNVTVGLYYPQEDYINVEVTPINYHATVNQNTTVEFNIDFEISGGDSIQMKMSDLVEGYLGSGDLGFVIGDGTNYTVEELNARLVYDGNVYSVGNEYANWTKKGDGTKNPITFPVGVDGIARGSATFKMNITSTMLSGNYHGTYQFDVTQT